MKRGENFSWRRLTLAIAASISLMSCQVSDGRESSAQTVSRWNSYGPWAGRTEPWGKNAKGEDIGPYEFKGECLWVTYSKPWCGACRSQVGPLKASERQWKKVAFVTILESDEDVFSMATEATAKRWASRHGLDPEFVVGAGSNPRTVPSHALFTATGMTAYYHTGYLSDADIDRTLKEAACG